ncbi:MAG TPA: DUF2235 domain-containing protein [Solirubrobacterales bacterium]|jgi:uncharacterized protein (DUF2235 family)|nr:DUF2235 domain-containing protein [Solirubrobacterales bacterium]
MRRLVICCDGTWNKPESQNVTNIEKIARTIETNDDRTGGTEQLVHYLSGVGSHYYWFDRILGGAFGFGLFSNVTAGYRFLALNYEPGDEIYVFGFSRGAYTARSLVGMIGRIGLLSRDGLIANKLPEAVDRYRCSPGKKMNFGSSNEEFKRDNCHAPKIKMIGVFDTVGALGVPGAIRSHHQFHDVKLSSAVQCARQALAIDERRLKFEPSLWEASESPDEAGAVDRVKQVWFEGVHSDVGGGYGETGLSDTTLLWMAQEASRQGLVFDRDRLDAYVASGSSPQRHDSLNAGYMLINAVGRLRHLFKPNPRFKGTRRVFNPPGTRDVKISSSASQHGRDDDGYLAPNLDDFIASTPDGGISNHIEDVISLPESSIGIVHERLTVPVARV